MQPLRAFLTLLTLAIAFPYPNSAAEATVSQLHEAQFEDAFACVDIPVCKTSIYIGSVTMTTSRFRRQGEYYQAGYQASVFPFFFYREKGTLSIKVDSTAMAQLAKGEKILIQGTATTSSGESRRIDCTATPTDIHSGILKIKVLVSRSIKLSFTTSYRFVAESTTTTSPGSR